MWLVAAWFATSPSGPFRMIAFYHFHPPEVDNIRYVKNRASPFLRLYCSIKFGHIFVLGRLQALGVGSICGGRESRLKLRSLAAFAGFLVMANTPQMCCVALQLGEVCCLLTSAFNVYIYIYTIHIFMFFNLLYGYKYTVFWNPANTEKIVTVVVTVP